MADNAVPALVPKQQMPDVLDTLSAPQPPTIALEKKALFDSIAQDETAPSSQEATPLATVFSGLLWFGYAIAIVVALILVWSAANGLLQTLPH